MQSIRWQILNGPESAIPSEISRSHAFKLNTPPKTDIWRPNETADTFTAPFIYRSIKTCAFDRITVTVSAPWKTLFDQGGIAIAFPGFQPWKWIKTGIEFYNGQPALSTVTADRFSDWSLCPMPGDGGDKATFECRREGDILVVSSVSDGKKQPLREIMWAFLEDRKTDADMYVGVYAAKPTVEAGDASQGIEVTFEDLVLHEHI